MKNITKSEIRKRRTRAKIFGTSDVPRLNVFASNSHIFAQIIDDEKGVTLIASSDKEKSFKGKGNKTEIAAQVGKAIAKKANEKKIKKVVFDRGSKLYHGRIAALAESARKEGLKL